jgi:hypothetical protein
VTHARGNVPSCQTLILWRCGMADQPIFSLERQQQYMCGTYMFMYYALGTEPSNSQQACIVTVIDAVRRREAGGGVDSRGG